MKELIMRRYFSHWLQVGALLLTVVVSPLQAQAVNACDLNADGLVNAADVDLAVGMSTGAIKPCTANVIGQGICNVVMTQRVINAARGGACGRTVTLNWTASTSAGVTGYKIYRSTVSGGSYVVLTTSPVAATTYVDSTVTPGTTYYYVVTAVGSATAESGYSNQATAVVPQL